MWPGHAAGDRVDRVADVDALAPRAARRARARRAAPARPRARSRARRRPSRVGEHDRDVLAPSSSARCARPSRAAPRSACLRPAPNAPKRTFATERFIARPIISVSSVPEAPTSAPLTIRTLLCSTKPVAAAARPVNAFSSEITTGMSAPPIGSTKRTPKTSAADDQRRRAATAARAPATISAAERRARPGARRVDELLPGIDDRPPADQLLQLRERDQRARERDRADRAPRAAIATQTSQLAARRVAARRLWNSASAISAAAPPPTPLNSATICGIAVIFTGARRRRRSTAPIAIATHDPARSSRARRCRNVTTIASAIPAAPTGCPSRARRAGREEPQRQDEGHDRDQVEQVGRGRGSFAASRRAALLEHLEHPVGDDEAADDVGRAEHDGDEADDPRQRVRVGRARRRGSRRR